MREDVEKVKIKEYESEQFAGTRNEKIKFDDGMNVILGKNEAGKSTMLSAIFHTFFTSSKLDKRKNKEFMNQFFPTSGAKTIDAVLRVQCGTEEDKEQRCYEIEKIWDLDGKEGKTKVKEIDGDVSRGAQAEQQLCDLLKYGMAFYKNLVFHNQNYEEEILEWLYTFFSDIGSSEEEIMTIKANLAQAFSAAGGISEEKFLAVLEEKMTSLAGKWNFEKDAPEKNRGIEKKWKRDVGAILDSYYKYKEAEKSYEEAMQCEEELAQKTRQLEKIKEEKEKAGLEIETLQSQQTNILNKSNMQKLLENVTTKRQRYVEVLEKWPGQQQLLEEGKKLFLWQQQKEQQRQYEAIKERVRQACDLKEEIEKISKKEADVEELAKDCKKVNHAISEIEKNEIRLSSVKLMAKLCVKKGYEQTVQLEDAKQKGWTSLGAYCLENEKTKEAWTIRDEEQKQQTGERRAEIEAEGFLNIHIPDVMDVFVSPKQLDVEKCRRLISENEAIKDAIFQKYGVKTPEQLQQQCETWQKKIEEKRIKQRELEHLLGGETLQCLKQQKREQEEKIAAWKKEESDIDGETSEKKEAIGTNGKMNEKEVIGTDDKTSEKKEIVKEEKIQQFLKKTGKETVGAGITMLETFLMQYEENYGSCEALRQKSEELQKEEEKYGKQLAELAYICMTEEEYEREYDRLKEKQRQMEGEKDELTGQIGRLEKEESTDVAELEQDMDRWRRQWEYNKKIYHYYEQIKSDFLELKKENKNKFDQFYNRFYENLSVITQNQMGVQSFENIVFSSGKNKITSKELLSEGTKKTVVLAFHLAVLDCFYESEKEGGFVIFDDILLDMDKGRRENSVKLLKKFAQKNQVIFTTCDEAIAKMLGGTLICL